MGTAKCEYCGESFKKRRKAAQFCSRSCKSKNQNENRGYASREKMCPVCGKHFHANNANSIRCSRECYSKTRRRAAPKPAPWETPRMSGETRGLRKSP